jgi:hypothetical protein
MHQIHTPHWMMAAVYRTQDERKETMNNIERLLNQPEATKWKTMARNNHGITAIVAEIRNTMNVEVSIFEAKSAVLEYIRMIQDGTLKGVTVRVSDDCTIEAINIGNGLHRIKVTTTKTTNIDSNDLLQTISDLTREHTQSSGPRA